MVKKIELTPEAKRLTKAAKRGFRKRRGSIKSKRNASKRKGLSPARKRELMRKTNWKCHVCGRRIVQLENVDIDHIRPRVHGGHDIEGNYLACCKRCNSLRGRLHHTEIRDALAFGKWAMQEIRKQTTAGKQLANLYGKRWAKEQEQMKLSRKRRAVKKSSQL